MELRSASLSSGRDVVAVLVRSAGCAQTSPDVKESRRLRTECTIRITGCSLDSVIKDSAKFSLNKSDRFCFLAAPSKDKKMPRARARASLQGASLRTFSYYNKLKLNNAPQSDSAIKILNVLIRMPNLQPYFSTLKAICSIHLYKE